MLVNPEVRQYLQVCRPMLRRHLDDAGVVPDLQVSLDLRPGQLLLAAVRKRAPEVFVGAVLGVRRQAADADPLVGASLGRLAAPQRKQGRDLVQQGAASLLLASDAEVGPARGASAGTRRLAF